ncbi:hypothetical protein B0H66DRAFT_499974 [Apodospora peruviana]|uniref:DUF1996 domain-containing protein n=1 Tax=Apodospora peruviana TaxID=516989 RepID=A0AAE0I129_9PEZI|nr:hypothetical protein B0H66DRAFT_499974 [Apodospora peruviana]
MKTTWRWWIIGLVSHTHPGVTELTSGQGLKMSCSQLVVDRIDPIQSPGVIGSNHLHQIVGGNSFNATMSPQDDPSRVSTCTTCTLLNDFSNYWTATMFYRHPNGTYRRVRQLGALWHESAREGGMTVYYFPPARNLSNIVAFKPGFRMRNGSPDARNATSASRYQGIQYTCMMRDDTRYTNLTDTFPDHPCPAGILTTIYFPPCWDGVNLDSPDHYSHVAWPTTGRKGFEQGDPCPASHPVKIPQVVLETRWDTRLLNNVQDWPRGKGQQPFVWSFGDSTGYGHHGDYIFGWKGDALNRAFTNCSTPNCDLPSQEIYEANRCAKEAVVKEEVDRYITAMPGGILADGQLSWGRSGSR